MAKSLIKTIYKSSMWCKILLVIIIVLVFFIGSKTVFETKEGFINQTENQHNNIDLCNQKGLCMHNQ